MPLDTIWTSNWGEGPKTILCNSCISYSCSNGILTTLSSLVPDEINTSFPDRPSQTDKSYLCRHQGSSFCRSRWVGLGFWFTSLTHWVSELAGHWCCQIWHMCSHSSQPKVHMHWHKGEARDIRSTSNHQKGSITKLLSPCIAYVHQQHHRACMHNLTIRWLQDTHCQSLKWVHQDRRITTLTWFSCWWTTHIFFKSQRFLRALKWHSNSKE